MAHPDLVALLKRSVESWNAWRHNGVLPKGFSRLNPAWAKTPDFIEVDLSGADLGYADLSNSNFAKAKLVGTTLFGANLEGAKMEDTDLRGACLDSANLPRADLRRARLGGASFSAANLNGANLNRASLNFTNLYQAKLVGAILSDADLYMINGNSVSLVGAMLANARLESARLNLANLAGADLTGAKLDNADLRFADLRRANLRGASLWDAYLKLTKLESTDFDQAILGSTSFVNLDLRGACNLENVKHRGPSNIGIDTLLKSDGRIPESFLRNAGVPEEWITQLPSLLGALQGIQFYSCFISHSHEDHEFCKRLHSRMQAEHLRVWFAPEDMPWGKKLHEEIETQIRIYDKLLIVLSSASMKSEWVATEIYHARQRELKEGRRILFPIALCPYEEIRAWKCFDTDTGKDLARELREYLIPTDFSQWKDHDAFEAAFAKLLKGLKAGSARGKGG